MLDMNTIIILGALVLVLVIILIFALLFLYRLNRIDESIRRSDSKINDLNCTIKRPLFRIEQRCDAIDQRTKAHLVSKKKSDKTKNPNDQKAKTHLSKKKFKSVINEVNTYGKKDYDMRTDPNDHSYSFKRERQISTIY